MNKKQLIVISVLVFSMLVLAVSQGFFESNFHRINTTDKVVNQFKKYKLNTDECFISIPDGWIVDEEKSEGQYISYKLKFKSANEDITGIIQVINTKEDVDVFANRDVRNQLLKFSNLKISPINNKDKNGILSEYTTFIRNGNNYDNKCYYLSLNDNQILKMLFNIRNTCLNDDTNLVLEDIISSLKDTN